MNVNKNVRNISDGGNVYFAKKITGHGVIIQDFNLVKGFLPINIV